MLTPDRGLNHRLHRPVPQVLRHRVGNENDVTITDRNIRVKAAQHALQIQCCNSAASLLLANQNGLCQRRVLSRPPRERERLHKSCRLHRIYRKTTWPDDIANHVYKAGPTHLNGVTRAAIPDYDP